MLKNAKAEEKFSQPNSELIPSESTSSSGKKNKHVKAKYNTEVPMADSLYIPLIDVHPTKAENNFDEPSLDA